MIHLKNLKNFLDSSEEELSNVVSNYFKQHLEYIMQHSFRNYFLISDTSKNWIRNSFEMNINEIRKWTHH